MSFWKKDKPLPITNSQNLTASQQEKILRAAKLNQQDIKKLKNKIESTHFLNPNRRISLEKMKTILKKENPKLAKDIKSAFQNYQKKAEQYLDEFCQEQYEIGKLQDELKAKIPGSDKNLAQKKASQKKLLEKIRSNITRTRKYDRQKERLEKYLQEKNSNHQNIKTSALKNYPKQDPLTNRANTSASRFGNWQKTDQNSDKAEEKPSSPPDLPI